MKQDWPEHFIMKRQGAHGARAGLIACAAVAFLGSEAEVSLCSASAGVFKARRVPPALFPDLTGERSGSSHRSRKWDSATTLTPFLQSGSGLRLPAGKEAPGAARPCTSTLPCRDAAGDSPRIS